MCPILIFLQQDIAILGVGAEILSQLGEDKTISELWGRVRTARDVGSTPLSFDWFVLTLTFLYAVAAIDLVGGVIVKRVKS